MEILADSTTTALILAPIEKVNLTEWLFTLKDFEYQSCSPAHIAGGTTVSKEGKRMSINVEQIADNLLVQHYVEDISEKSHCRVNSHSDSLSPAGSTKLGITWELTVKKVSDTSCELSNRVLVLLSDEFSSLLKKANITDLTPIKSNMAKNAGAHNKEETPLFAKDIERKALVGIWG
jgi:hypothetical protein